MKKHLERMLIKMGDKAAKQGVNSASPGFCFQLTRTNLDCINSKLMYLVQILPPIQVRKTGIVIVQQMQIRGW